MQKLFLNSNGSPVDSNVKVDGILNMFPVGPISAPVYQDFTNYMDSLVSSKTIHEWKPLAYDWRYGPEQILADGVATPSGTVDLIQEVEQMAQTSDTGKVTIVAHSMGGLMGKAIIQKLIQKGEQNLIDSFVMVASPQLGTPQATAGLLHGEGSDITWDLGPIHFVLINKADPRALGQNMQGAYNLLPSSAYYQNVIDAPVTFSATTTLTASWRGQWGIALGQFSEFFDFLTGNGPDRTHPAYSDTQSPEVLRPDLLNSAVNFHSQFDSFAFSPNIHVVQIAGWGLPTIKGIEYVESHGKLDYRPVTTSEGDNTVVYPSAVPSSGASSYFFNLDSYNDTNKKTSHRDLIGTSPILAVIKSIVTQSPVAVTQYILQLKPTPPDVVNRLLVSVHSPATIGVYDSQGRFTGVTPNQDSNADVQFITKDIPGSDYYTFGDGKYISVPQNGIYTVALQGTGSGDATVDIEKVENDIQTGIARYPGIPVTPATSASLVLDSATPKNTQLSLDFNGDGSTDQIWESELNKKPLTVSAENKTILLGDSLPNLTAAFSGFVNGDTLATSGLTGNVHCATTATTASPVGVYPINCELGTLASNRYSFASFVAGTLTINYRWDGFLQPINDTGHQIGQSLSVFKAGSTVPVKLQLKKIDGSTVQSSGLPMWLPPQKGSSMSASVDESVYTSPATDGNAFKWDATGQQYIYNWSTKGLAAGYWYRIYTQLNDGKIYSVTIGLR